MAQKLTKAKTQAYRMLQRKKYRQLDGVFIAEGPNLVEAALDSGQSMEAVLVQGDLRKEKVHRRLLERVAEKNVALYDLTDRQVQVLSDTDTPQGLMAVVRMTKTKLDPAALHRAVMLVDVQDPANVGAVIRTAWCLGYRDVLLAGRCADAYSPKVVRGTMGGIFHVNVHGVKSPQSAIERCRKAAVTVLATAGGARDFASVAVSGPRLLVVGNESRGLRPEVAQAADETVGIPMAESAESLNVSVAAGILMHHYARPIERLPV